jgi:protein-S-isoprenylcysteine O-methyltransferase Ste14
LLVAFAVQHEPEPESIYEEAWLIERFPEYAFYRARTPRRFVPWLY